MRIDSLNMNLTAMGLGQIEMTGLGRVVVLAGPNGAGKSRLLVHLRNELQTLYQPSDPGLSHLMRRVRTGTLTERESLALEAFKRGQERLKGIRISGDPSDAIHFWPKPGGFGDPMQFTERALMDAAKFVRSAAPHNAQRLFGYFHWLRRRWREATHQQTEMTPDEVVRIRNEYESLNSVLERFLGTTLQPGVDGTTTLFDRPLGDSLGCSHGEQILLQVIGVLNATGRGELRHAVLLIDEPENHLHPRALRDVLRDVESLVPDGQVWIATHSVHLIADHSLESVWWLDKDGVRPVRRDPSIVLRGIVGEDADVGRLREFLDAPEVMARSRFAAECLTPPPALDTAPGDPQTTQIAKVLASLRERQGSQRPIKVLDYGAGRARLLGELHALHAELLAAHIDYFAHDPSPEHQPARRDQAERAYGGEGERELRDLDRACAEHAGSFDVIVLCNVLHEIPPTEWEGLLGPKQVLQRLLRPDGMLVIVEDTQIAHGELAHRHGFLLLEQQHLHELFRCTPQDTIRDQAREGRLQATAIPSRLLANVSRDSVVATLGAVVTTASKEMDRLAQAGVRTYRDGLAHARAVHSYANAARAVDVLRGHQGA